MSLDPCGACGHHGVAQVQSRNEPLRRMRVAGPLSPGFAERDLRAARRRRVRRRARALSPGHHSKCTEEQALSDWLGLALYCLALKSLRACQRRANDFMRSRHRHSINLELDFDSPNPTVRDVHGSAISPPAMRPNHSAECQGTERTREQSDCMLAHVHSLHAWFCVCVYVFRLNLDEAGEAVALRDGQGAGRVAGRCTVHVGRSQLPQVLRREEQVIC